MARVREETAAGTPGGFRQVAAKSFGLNEHQTRQCRSLLKTMSSLVEAAARTDDPFEQVGFWESFRELQLQLEMIIPSPTCLSPAA
jgi:hypothetical protein